MTRPLLGLAIVAACSREPAALGVEVAHVNMIATAAEPYLDVFAARIQAIKRRTAHVRLDGETLQLVELANDRLGLPPFEQIEPAGPGHIIPPMTLLGYGPYSRDAAAKLGKAGDRHDLDFLDEDLMRRYREEIPQEAQLVEQAENAVAGATSGSAR